MRKYAIGWLAVPLETAALALLLSCVAARSGVMAQPAPGERSSVAGRWLYDPRGHIIGSVRSITDDGRAATIIVGTYFQPGSYAARIPASALSFVNGRVTLQGETIQALSAGSALPG